MVTSQTAQNVAILGASDDPERYAYKAFLKLKENGYHPVPVNPYHEQIDGHHCYPELPQCAERIDTVTVYVRPAILVSLVDDLLQVSPRHVILNPGTESNTAKEELEQEGVKVIEACTLVLLNNGQFPAV